MPMCLSDYQIKARLRSHFRKALDRSKFKTRQVFLELYAGSMPISTHIHRAGYAVLGFEITQGSEFDLTDPRVHAIVLGWLRSKCVAGVFVSIQCSSWSRALRGPPGSNWAAIRESAHIHGLPGLSENQQKRVNLGNLQLTLCSQIIRICNLNNIPIMLENPYRSFIFETPEMQALLAAPSCEQYVCDQCQYGAPWRKATRFICWNCNYIFSLSERCTGRQGICSRSHKHHIVLSGTSKEHGLLWTTIAKGYPKRLAKALGDSLINSAVSKRLNK